MQCGNLNPWIVIASVVLMLVAAFLAGRSAAWGALAVEWGRISREWGDLRREAMKLRALNQPRA